MADTAARPEAGEKAVFVEVFLKDWAARDLPKAIPNKVTAKGREKEQRKSTKDSKLLADEKFESFCQGIKLKLKLKLKFKNKKNLFLSLGLPSRAPPSIDHVDECALISQFFGHILYIVFTGGYPSLTTHHNTTPPPISPAAKNIMKTDFPKPLPTCVNINIQV